MSKFEQVIMGKAFKVKQWSNDSGKKWQTFSFTYGKQDQQSCDWVNVYMNVTLFLKPDDFIHVRDGDMLKISGKFEPNFYQKRDGTFVETLAFVGFEVLEVNNKKEEKPVNLDDLSDEDLEVESFDDDLFEEEEDNSFIFPKDLNNKGEDDEDCPF